MSFTLRNLFSEDGGTPSNAWSEAGGKGGKRENAPEMKSDKPVEGQTYLVSELLPFIPPAIAASGAIPMEKEVLIPMASGGSTDVTLSTIHQQCPELFDAEITPLNDSTVTLPVKLGQVKEAAVAGGSAIFDAPGTPFGAPGFGFDEAIAGAEDNPFWSPDSDDETSEASDPPTPMNEDQSSRFPSTGASDVSTKEIENVFEDGGLPEKKPATFPKEPETAPKSQSENPFGDPASSDIDDGIPPGFSENPFESDQNFSTLFSSDSKGDGDHPFPVAGNDEAAWGAMFGEEVEPSEGTPTGFGEMLQKDDHNQPKKEEPEPQEEEKTPTMSAPPTESAAPAKEPIQQQATIKVTPTQPAQPAPEAAPSSGFSDGTAVFDKTPVPASTPAEDPFSAPVEKAEEPEPVQAEEPVKAEPATEVVAKVEPSVEETPAPVSEPAPKVEAEVSAPAMPAMAASGVPGEVSVSERDLELRAIFSSDETFTLAKVARLVVGLEGVNACALATPAKLVQASRDEQSRLGDEAKEMVDAIRNLANLTGLPEARTFTLQTDRGTVSLFLEGDCCVTINHQSLSFGPGVREKLILVARSIHKLQE